jgi:hypothetical protein
MQDKAWAVFEELHAKLDADRRARIIVLVKASRAARARVGKV